MVKHPRLLLWGFCILIVQLASANGNIKRAQPALTSPAAGTAQTASPVLFTGTCTDGDNIEVSVDGVDVTTFTGTQSATCASSAFSISIAIPSDGSYEWSATDGTTPATAIKFYVDRDTGSPPAEVLPADNTHTNDNTPTISGKITPFDFAYLQINDDDENVEEGQADEAGDFSFTTSTLTDGSYTLHLWSQGPAKDGSTKTTTVTQTLVVDTTAPTGVPSITKPTADFYYTTHAVQFTGSVSEANIKVEIVIGDAVKRAVVSSSNNTVTSGVDKSFTWTISGDGLAEGAYVYTITAIDLAGNRGTSATGNFFVDVTAPAIPQTDLEAGDFIQSLTFSGTVTDTDVAAVKVKINGTAANDAIYDTDDQSWSFTKVEADGDYQIELQAVDNAGLTSAWSTAIAVHVDGTAPGQTTFTKPADGITVFTATPVFSGVAPEEHCIIRIVTGTFAKRVDYDVEADVNGTTWTWTPPADLPEGENEFSVVCVDRAENTGAPQTITFYIDITPAKPSLYINDGELLTNDNTTTISGTTYAKGRVLIKSDTLAGGEQASEVADGEGEWSYTWNTAVADGDHEIEVYAYDIYDEASGESADFTLTVDTAVVKPTITYPTADLLTNDNTPVINGTAEAGSTVQIFIDNDSYGTTTASQSGIWTKTVTSELDEGDHVVTANYTDDAGNMSPSSDSVSFTVDTEAPDAPEIDNIANNGHFFVNRPTITGSAESEAKIYIVFDGVGEGPHATADVDGDWTYTFQFNLTEGIYSIKAYASDAAGNNGDESDAVSFTVVFPPGAPTFTSPEKNSWNNDETLSVSGTAKNGSTITVSVNGSASAPVVADAVTGVWTWSHDQDWTDGYINITAVAADSFGHTSDVAVWGFYIDTVIVAPVVASPVNESYLKNNMPTFVMSTEAFAEIEVSIVGTPIKIPATADANGVVSVQYGQALPDGTYVAKVVATDRAENESPATTIVVTIDTGVPAAPVFTAPAANSHIKNRKPAISGTHTGEAHGNIDIYYSGSKQGNTTVNDAGQWSWTPAADLLDAKYDVYVIGTDRAGNASPQSATRTFWVDNVAPVAPVLSAPINGKVLGTVRPTFKGTAEADSVVHIVGNGTADISVNANSETGAFEYNATSDLAEGVYNVHVYAVDKAGNVGPSTADIFYTVRFPPAAPVISTPANKTFVKTNRPTFTGTGKAKLFVEVRANGVQIGTATVGSDDNWTITPTANLTDGVYLIDARAFDADEIYSAPTAAISITVDTHADAPVITAPTEGLFLKTNSPTINGTAEPGALVMIYIDNSPKLAVYADSKGDWWFAFGVNLGGIIAEGARNVSAYQTDLADNMSPRSVTVNFTIDLTAPVAPVITAPTEGQTVYSRYPKISGTSEPFATVDVFSEIFTELPRAIPHQTVTADAAGNWEATPQMVVDEGSYEVTARATDRAGNQGVESAARSFDVVHPSAAPEFTAPTAERLAVKRPTFTGTVNGQAASLTIKVNGSAPITVPISAGEFSYTVQMDLADGKYTVEAQTEADDGFPSEIAEIVFWIDTVAHAPVITAPAAGSTLTTSLPQIVGTVSDEDIETITVYVDGEAVGTVSYSEDDDDNWSVQLEGELDDGQHNVSASVTDDLGNISPKSAVVAFVIDTTGPAAPVIVKPAEGATVYTKRPTISGTTEAHATVEIQETGYDSSTTVEADASGNWEYNVTEDLPEGEVTFQVRAADIHGNNGAWSEERTFTVEYPPAAPEIEFPMIPVYGTARPTFNGSAVASGNVVFSVDGATNVAWTTTTNANGRFSWQIPQTLALADGAHNISAHAVNAGGVKGEESEVEDFHIKTVATAPVFTLPSNGTLLTTKQPSFSGVAEQMSTVYLYIDEVNVANITVVTVPNPSHKRADFFTAWSFAATADLSEGRHNASATIKDLVGTQSARSAYIYFTVDTVAPAKPVITSPVAESTVYARRPTFNGTAEAGSTVEINAPIGAKRLGSYPAVVADAAGKWHYRMEEALPEGGNTVSARATDPAGNVGSWSDQITYDISYPPAEPTVVAPVNNHVYAVKRPAFTGRALGGATVYFNIDGVKNDAFKTVVEAADDEDDGDGDWTYTVDTDFAEGSHSVSAHVVDPGNQVGEETDAINFIIDTIADAPIITTANITKSRQPVLEGTAEKGATVKIVNATSGALLNNAVANANTGKFSYQYPTELIDGTYKFGFQVTDAHGNVGQFFNITIRIVNTPPPAPVVTPPDPTKPTPAYNSTKPTLTGSADPYAKVDIEINTGAKRAAQVFTVFADGNGVWTFTPDFDLPQGETEMRFRTTDAAGNVGAWSAPVTVTVKSAPPTTPTNDTPNNKYFTSKRPTFTGKADVGDTVEILIDSVSQGTDVADAQGDWSIAVTTDLDEGSHTFVARVTDIANNVASTSPLTFIIDTVAPVVVIESPEDESKVIDRTPVISGTTEANSVVSIEINDQTPVTVNAASDGKWQYQVVADLSNGEYTLTVKATDAAGNEGAEATSTFSVIDDPEAASSSSSGGSVNVGVIVGPIIAGLVVIAIVAVVAFMLIKRKRVPVQDAASIEMNTVHRNQAPQQ